MVLMLGTLLEGSGKGTCSIEKKRTFKVRRESEKTPGEHVIFHCLSSILHHKESF